MCGGVNVLLTCVLYIHTKISFRFDSSFIGLTGGTDICLVYPFCCKKQELSETVPGRYSR
jgi:hypothetical protein